MSAEPKGFEFSTETLKQNPVAKFVKCRCLHVKNAEANVGTLVQTLYGHYTKWCKDEGIFTLDPKTFGQLGQQFLGRPSRMNGLFFWQGVIIQTDEGRKRAADAAELATRLQWAEEQIAGWRRWRRDGKIHRVDGPTRGLGPSGYSTGVQTQEDIVSEAHELPMDLDYGDWLRIERHLREFVAGRPDLALLPELLSHVGEAGAESLLISVPFCGTKRRLGSMGPGAVANAKAAVVRFTSHVARSIDYPEGPGGESVNLSDGEAI